MPETSQETLKRELELIAMCDATPVLMSDETHDNAVALTSHAPHVMAALMTARLVDSPNDVARLAVQGLRDTVRIANGAPGLSSDILRSHAVPLARVLAEVREDLAEAVAALDTLESSPGRDLGPRRLGGRVRDRRTGWRPEPRHHH